VKIVVQQSTKFNPREPGLIVQLNSQGGLKSNDSGKRSKKWWVILGMPKSRDLFNLLLGIIEGS